jgi:hypothetical protein
LDYRGLEVLISESTTDYDSVIEYEESSIRKNLNNVQIRALNEKLFSLKSGLDIKAEFVDDFLNYRYFFESFYSKHTEYIHRADQIVFFEDLTRDPHSVVSSIFELTGLKHLSNLEKRHSNQTLVPKNKVFRYLLSMNAWMDFVTPLFNKELRKKLRRALYKRGGGLSAKSKSALDDIFKFELNYWVKNHNAPWGSEKQ